MFAVGGDLIHDRLSSAMVMLVRHPKRVSTTQTKQITEVNQSMTPNGSPI